MFIIYGINHVKTGYAKYMSVTLYGLNGIAFASLNSDDDMEGTAAKFIPNSPNVDKLFAVVMARDCQNYANCLKIPYAGSKGLPAGVPPLMVSRNILNPQTGTGADSEELVPTRLMFAKLPRIAPLYKNKTKNGVE